MREGCVLYLFFVFSFLLFFFFFFFCLLFFFCCLFLSEYGVRSWFYEHQSTTSTFMSNVISFLIRVA